MNDRACAIMDMLSKKGYKKTPQREAIIRGFIRSDKSLMTARELYETVVIDSPNTNFSTVYRNLELLTQEGIIARMDMGGEASMYRLKDNGGHHHYLICKRCGKIQETEYCPFKNMDIGEEFTAVDHRFEVYGFCKECTDKNSNNEL
ncbi:MAG TPA: transcriptional repressor [Clostridiales bacterium]|nr:transcriptional repressor [Clostridiales bacterium]